MATTSSFWSDSKFASSVDKLLATRPSDRLPKRRCATEPRPKRMCASAAAREVYVTCGTPAALMEKEARRVHGEDPGILPSD